MTSSSINLKVFLHKRFILRLIIGSGIVFIIAWLFTAPLIVKPLYESEAIVNPPLTLVSQQYYQQGIGFGGDAEIDWYVQVLLSSMLRDSIAQRFDLYEQWGIDDTTSSGRSQMHRKIAGAVRVEKNRYGSVSIRVRNHDPYMAAQMAQAIVELGDKTREVILEDNRIAAYQLALHLYEAKEQETREMRERLFSQPDIDTGQTHQIQSEAFRQRILYENELRILAELKNDYEIMRKSIQTRLPSTYIVSEPIPPHKPVWPPRLLFALGAVLVFGILYIFFEILKYDTQSATDRK